MKKSKNSNMQYRKLPGSNKQRNRARNLLKCEAIKGGWLITGGENEHIVKPTEDALICDCDIHMRKKKICSHVIKVQMVLGIFPEPTLVKVGEK